MLSKILLPGDPREVTLPEWRQRAGGGADMSAAAAKQDIAGEIARAEQACRQRVAEARAEGLREGEAAGRSRAAAELQPVIERLARSVEETAALRPKLRLQAEADMIRLALAIARRILRREVAADPEAMQGLVLGALDKLRGLEINRVRVNPAQVAAVKACLAAAGSEVEVLGDRSREPGAAFFETTRGNLDASMDSQLEEIERGLAARLNRQS
jgi:flagellar assembly protein FliH